MSVVIAFVLSGRSCGSPNDAIRTDSEAQQVLAEAQSLSEGPWTAWLDHRALEPVERENIARAAAMWKRLADYKPRSLAFAYGAGMSWLVVDEFAKAEPLLRQAVANAPQTLNPDTRQLLADTYYALSRTQLSLKKPQEAIDSASQAIKLQPRLPDYFWARASAYAEQREMAKAEADLRNALKLDPQHAKSQALLRFLESARNA